MSRLSRLQSMEGSLPPPLLQNRACHFRGTRLLSDAPSVIGICPPVTGSRTDLWSDVVRLPLAGHRSLTLQRGFSASQALLLRSPAPHRPHVSISWALPQALASCGILPNTPCGWHLLTTTRESTCQVTPFPVPIVASVGRCSPPGFCGSAHRSVWKAAGALSCAVLAPVRQPLALVGLHDGSLHLCLRCP